MDWQVFEVVVWRLIVDGGDAMSSSFQCILRLRHYIPQSSFFPRTPTLDSF